VWIVTDLAVTGGISHAKAGSDSGVIVGRAEIGRLARISSGGRIAGVGGRSCQDDGLSVARRLSSVAGKTDIDIVAAHRRATNRGRDQLGVRRTVRIMTAVAPFHLAAVASRVEISRFVGRRGVSEGDVIRDIHARASRCGRRIAVVAVQAISVDRRGRVVARQIISIVRIGHFKAEGARRDMGIVAVDALGLGRAGQRSRYRVA